MSAARPEWTLGHVPVAPFMAARTASAPGIEPLDPGEWLYVDEDFAGQMALRDALILGPVREDLGPVVMTAGGEAAAAELLELVVEEVLARRGARRTAGGILRPDGVEVALEGDPMAVAGRLAQEDLLVMERPEGAPEHVLTAGVLCFPAHWRLDEKMGRPLLRIHMPVPEYPGDLERRVQRFFDGVKAGRPLRRANWHFAASPEIVTPAREAEKTGNFRRRLADGEGRAWLRVERQTVLRMPRTGAVVFGVRTLMSEVEGFTPAQWRALAARLAEMPEAARARKCSPAVAAKAAAMAAAAEGTA